MHPKYSAWLTFRAEDPSPEIDVLSVELLGTPANWTAWGAAMFHATLPGHSAVDQAAKVAADQLMLAAGWTRTSDWMESDLGYAAHAEPA